MSSIKYLLIIDLEATCSKDNAVPRQEMEIIEIGAVMLSVTEGINGKGDDSHKNIGYRPVEHHQEFQTFVKPMRHAQLSDFCKELTSIQQVDVDQAPLYQDAIKLMSNWMEGFATTDEILFCSWGKYDKNQFNQDCIWNGVAYPFSESHCNIKKLFSTAPGQGKPSGLGKAIKKLGWEFSGTAHRGIDDARNIARIVQWMSEQGIEVRPD